MFTTTAISAYSKDNNKNVMFIMFEEGKELSDAKVKYSN
jgi:hypothetical protein